MIEKWKTFASNMKQPQRAQGEQYQNSSLDIDAWIEKYNIPVTGRTKEDNNGDRYIGVQCPNDENHKDAAIIRRANGTLQYNCFHNSCAGWGWREYRQHYEPDAYTKQSQNDIETEKKPSQADKLIEIINDCEVFHDELKDTHVKIKVKNHAEVWPVRSTMFKRWLVGRYYAKTGKACNTDSVNMALNVAEAKGLYEGAKIPLSLRCAERDGAFWYDLANEQWEAVKITADGWEVVPSPIMFRRFANTAQQVKPLGNGDITPLKHFVNLKCDDDFKLLCVYLVSCLIPNIPKILMPLAGEKGASKSTMLRVARRLIDPANKDLLTLPNDPKELALILYKNYMPAFDNLSTLNEWQSDTLCCAATGGGISKRRLYTDDEEIFLSFLRCVTLNGINTVATKPDLLDRSIAFELERIDEENRQSERQFWTEFENVRPRILGGMFDVLAKAINVYPSVKLDGLPRMADFCLWGYAIAEAMGWTGEEFLTAYYSNINAANDEAIRNSPVAAAVVAFMNNKTRWRGTSAELLKELDDIAWREKIDANSKFWPKSAMSLTKRLRHYKSNFADANLKYTLEYNAHTKINVIIFEKQLPPKGSDIIHALPANTAKPVNTRLFPAEVAACIDSETIIPRTNTRAETLEESRVGVGCGGCGDKIPTLLESDIDVIAGEF